MNKEKTIDASEVEVTEANIKGDKPNRSKFRKDLEYIINIYSLENRSNTPDFILAEYMVSCLDAFDKAEEARSKWYSA